MWTSEFGRFLLLLSQWTYRDTPLNTSEASCPAQSRAFDGNEDKVVELLRNWMNPNSKTEDEKHALHMALAQGHTAVVRQLLIFKADIWLEEGGRGNAVDIAIELAKAKQPDCLKLLVDLHEQYKAGPQLSLFEPSLLLSVGDRDGLSSRQLLLRGV